jgi:hypothetical protein
LTNGKALLEFKKGAFKDLKPMKIIAFKIPYNKFIPYDDWIYPKIGLVLMLMCNWWYCCNLYEFEGTFDPSYLNLDPNDRNAWKIYAEKVRNLISKVLKIP